MASKSLAVYVLGLGLFVSVVSVSSYELDPVPYTDDTDDVCSTNEQFVKCIDAYCVTDCEHLRSKPFCIAIADCDKPGCVCKEDFLRDAWGSCVPQDTCPQAKPVPDTTCPVNEKFVTCTDAVCWKTCKHLFTKPACAAIADCDKPGCVCKDGFLRNKRGVCVSKKTCQRKMPRNSYVCPANEIYAKCTDAVCWKTCNHLITRPPCAAIADCNKPGCVCKKDFLRNEKGVCVPSHTCPQLDPVPYNDVCSANERLVKCTDAFCVTDCEHLMSETFCIAIADCDKPGCVCKKGFLRDGRGSCVPQDTCPQAKPVLDTSCPVNEKFVSCTDAVCWKTCNHLFTKPACAAITDCDKPGCVCKDGFLRNEQGVCVSTKTCPLPKDSDVCPANEVYAKCTDAVCWKTCNHLITRPPCAAIADCDKPGCVCKKDFLRNERGVCVPSHTCPQLDPVPCTDDTDDVCSTNEQFVKCTDAVCVTDCEHLRSKPFCIAIADCDKPGCVCKEGFLRDTWGSCVPQDTCPQAEPVPDITCPVNEQFVNCTDAICWKNCNHLYNQPACPAITDCDKPGCVCNLMGFLRNEQGVCVRTENCPLPKNKAVCPANEVYAKCTDAVCWKTCDHLFTRPACVAIADCDKPGCVCRDGFLRNGRGVCVPIKTCPPPPYTTQCPVNEVLAKCADAVCWQTCEHLRRKPPCPAIADCDNPACVCQRGYFRDERGVCVSANRCYPRITDWYRSPSESYWYRNGDFRNF